MKRLACLAVAALLFVVASACSSSDNPVIPADGDAGQTADASRPETTTPDDASASDAGHEASTDAAPGECNTLTDVGANVSYVTSTDTAPTPAGGAISDGTYVLTAIVAYTSSQPNGTVLFAAGSATISIAGGAIQSVAHSAKNQKQTQSGTYTTANTDISITTTCSSSGVDAGSGARTTGYTATTTTFTIILDGGAQGVLATTYTKQ